MNGNARSQLLWSVYPGAIEAYPEPVGAPLPPELLLPHALMAPDESSAAKAQHVEAMLTYPEPVGAPLPPRLLNTLLYPHALMAPDESSAAKASMVEAMLTYPEPVGAPLPP